MEVVMTFIPKIDRRSLLASAAAIGGAFVLGFELPIRSDTAHAANGAPEINAWIVIHPDDSITLRYPRAEMGQGSYTALPMLLAEELECDWSKVKVEIVEPAVNLRRNRIYGDMFSTGSRTIRGSQDYVRKAGAAAREMLIAAAAQAWNVPARECRAENSRITHGPSERTVNFAKVAVSAAKLDPPKDVKLKDPKEWKLAGKPTRRLEISDKVQGKPIYGIDVRLPNMLYASLIQCPVFKGTLKSVDDSKLSGLRGVRAVVKLPNAVAVVADSWWRAKTAAEALQVTWNDGGNEAVSSQSIAEFVRTGLTSSDAGVGRKQGNVVEGLTEAVKRIDAEYYAPFQSHATMEPQNCTVRVIGDKAEIWVPTQDPERSLNAAAQALGIPRDNIILHPMMVGGGFGRRGGPQDFVTYPALVAKDLGAPVKVLWSREEDMQHDFYRPVTMAKMTAGLDASGMPIAWHVRLAGPSIQGQFRPDAIKDGVDRHMQEGFLDEMPYDVDNYLVEYALRVPHVPVGWWRAVNFNQNDFYMESFIDEMAYAAGQDPYRYRRKLIGKHPHAKRFLAVLDAVATKAGWETAPAQGVYRGLALSEAYGSYQAAVLEMSLGDNGEARVHRVVYAIDPGHAVNPLTIAEQAEGGIVWGLTATLYGEITIKDGRVEQSNFHDFQMLRLAEMPKVETIVMPSGGFWGGCGEPPPAIVAPALCNAIFAATGKRIRSLPLKNHDLRKA
jgi:isoquinoline 1-oxidoreductase beta subunit